MVPHSPAETAGMATIRNSQFWGVPVDAAVLPVLNRNSTVLDTGSGTRDGRVLTAILDNAETPPRVVRMDYYRTAIAANQGAGRIIGDATDIPLGNGCLDAVVTSELTPDNEYFVGTFGGEGWKAREQNRKRLGSEIVRVLRIGGKWIAYNERLALADDKPVGVRTIHRILNAVPVAPGRMSFSLPFAVFEKTADVIDPAMISGHATLTGGRYDDDYIRALNTAYPVEAVLGESLIREVKEGDVSDMVPGSPFMLSRYDGVVQSIVSAAKTGRWDPTIIRYSHPDLEKHLEELIDVNGQYRDARGAASIDTYLRNIMRRPYHKIVSLEGCAVILPTQRLLDELIDFRDTDAKTIGGIRIQSIKTLSVTEG